MSVENLLPDSIPHPMKFLVVSQVFWPDSASTSQQLTDLAEALVSRGHCVEVLSSCNQYENPKILYAKEEYHQGIHIKRLKQTAFGKDNKIGRGLNFLTFNLSLFFTLLCMQKGSHDVIIGTTVPPLSSFFNAVAAGLKKMRFCHWAMDLQPELSIVAGYLRSSSPLAVLLFAADSYALKKTDLVIALDKYMADHIARKSTGAARISVVPVWPVLEKTYDGPRQENPFRVQQSMGDRIVVMYSGNHAVVHPLDTLLEAADRLRDDPRFLFVFIGGGVRKEDVTRVKCERNLENILQLPYQKRENIHFSLSAADVHVVIQGNGCTGYTHPSKIYGAMFVGRPVLYIGPRPSHITDVLDECPGNLYVEHGQVEELVTLLQAFGALNDNEKNLIGSRNMEFVNKNLDRDVLIGKVVSMLELLHAE